MESHAALAVPHSAALPAVALAAPPAALGWHELATHRGALVRYARRRLLDPALAEDVVHDVFEAVLAGRARYEGRSAPRTWLTGILKHKIVDLVRQRAGLVSLDASDGDDDEPAPELASPQPHPEQIAEQRERLAQTLQRIEALPDTLREALTLRVLHEEPTAAVCARLAISEANLFVRLHRARRALLN